MFLGYVYLCKLVQYSKMASRLCLCVPIVGLNLSPHDPTTILSCCLEVAGIGSYLPRTKMENYLFKLFYFHPSFNINHVQQHMGIFLKCINLLFSFNKIHWRRRNKNECHANKSSLLKLANVTIIGSAV